MPRSGPDPTTDPALPADAEGAAPEGAAPADATPAEAAAEGAVPPASDVVLPAAPESATLRAPSQPAVPQRPEPPKRGKGRVRRVLGWFLRLVVIVALAVGIGAGVYFGWPVVYDRYLAPVQTNTTELGTLRDQVAELQRQIEDLTAADATVDERLSTIDERIAALDAMDATLASSDRSAEAETARQIHLLKAMELMSRARLFMFQSNYGLAEQDVEAAREILAGLGAGASSEEAASIGVAVDRLGQTMAALPDFPVAARDDLDIAWQALLGKVPTPGSSPGPSGDPDATAQPSPSATP
jgi:hypothetical protein